MSHFQPSYQLPDSLSPEQLLSDIQKRFQLKEEPQSESLYTYYDSFDWRLYLAGATLRHRSEGKEQSAVWGTLDESSIWESIRLKGGLPVFTWDFPAGRMQSDLTPLLEMRRLLPQVELLVRRQLFRVLDSEQKTVLWLIREEYQSRAPGEEACLPLNARLRLRPVRGYPKPLARMEELLEREVALERSHAPLLEEALNAIGRQAADYTSKLNFQFDPLLPAGDAARRIHLHLPDTVCNLGNAPGKLFRLGRALPGHHLDLLELLVNLLALGNTLLQKLFYHIL